MNKRRAVQASIPIAFAVWNTSAAYRGEQDDSLCKMIKDTFHTPDSRAGQVVWTLVWVPVAVWFWAHIARGVRTPGVQELVKKLSASC